MNMHAHIYTHIYVLSSSHISDCLCPTCSHTTRICTCTGTCCVYGCLYYLHAYEHERTSPPLLQLIRRNDELALLAEKLKVQHKTISGGELAYRERLEVTKER